MIGIIDIGVGNPKSVSNAFSHLNLTSQIVSSKLNISKCKKLILPGVGNFGAYIRKLKEHNIYDYLSNLLSSTDLPFLGICIGAQALLEGSDEDKNEIGLNILEGKSTLITPNNFQRVPNVGWRFIDNSSTNSNNNDRFYFSHSYSMQLSKKFIVSKIKQTEIVAIFQRDNIFGVQFHPEKSGQFGLTFLKKFADFK